VQEVTCDSIIGLECAKSKS